MKWKKNYTKLICDVMQYISQLDVRITYGEEVEFSDIFYHKMFFKSLFEIHTTRCQNSIA